MLDFSKPALELERKARAFNPWPGAFLVWQGLPLKVLHAHVIPEASPGAGRAEAVDRLPAVTTASGWLVLDLVQPAGKKPMPGDVFLRGARNWAGSEFPVTGQ